MRATKALLNVPVDAPWDNEQVGVPPALLSKLATPPSDIYKMVESSKTHDKGLGLELLALRIVTDLGLSPVAFRLRGEQTKGAEVDLIADGEHLHYSRWLIQCKNTGTVNLSDLAKEIGMAMLLKAHVILLITTGRFAGTVKLHADGLASTTPLQAVLLDRKALEAHRTRGGEALLDILESSAKEVLKLKRGQVLSVLSRSSGEEVD